MAYEGKRSREPEEQGYGKSKERKERSKMARRRSRMAVAAWLRVAAGPMKDRRQPRGGDRSWTELLERMRDA